MSLENLAGAPKDKTYVNVVEHTELLWWAAVLRATPEQVREAVNAVGPSPEDVRKRLQRAAKASFKNMGED